MLRYSALFYLFSKVWNVLNLSFPSSVLFSLFYRLFFFLTKSLLLLGFFSGPFSASVTSECAIRRWTWTNMAVAECPDYFLHHPNYKVKSGLLFLLLNSCTHAPGRGGTRTDHPKVLHCYGLIMLYITNCHGANHENAVRLVRYNLQHTSSSSSSSWLPGAPVGA